MTLQPTTDNKAPNLDSPPVEFGKPAFAVPNYVYDLMAACPSAGQGVNNWLYRAARALNPLYANKTDLVELLRAASAHCGREVDDREIQRAVENSARNLQEARERLLPSRPRWPKADGTAIAAITSAGPGVDALRKLSRVPFAETGRSRVEEVIDTLFPGNPLLCVGQSSERFDTRPRDQWRGVLEDQQLIVPSPKSAVSGVTQGGKAARSAGTRFPTPARVGFWWWSSIRPNGKALGRRTGHSVAHPKAITLRSAMNMRPCIFTSANTRR